MVSLNQDDGRLAETYDAISDSQFRNGQRLVRRLGIRSGQTVLDLGCGTGRLTLHVARHLGPKGRLFGLDPLRTRIRVAKQHNRFPNVFFKTDTSEKLGFLPSNSVDVVYLNAVFHWIVNKEATLAEIHRVLKPGGKLGLTTAAKELAAVSTLRSIVDSVLRRAPYRADPQESLTNRFGVTSTELIQWLIQFDLNILHLEIREVHREFRDPDHVVAHSESSSFGNYLSHVAERLRDKAKADIKAELAKLQNRKGIVLTGHTIFAVARKPLEKDPGSKVRASRDSGPVDPARPRGRKAKG